MGRQTDSKVTNIGMFNIFRGLGMLFIIFKHTFSSFGLWVPHGDVLSVGLVLQYLFDMVDFAIMPAFFIMSGFGLRKTKFSKCVKRQAQSLLIPYLYTMLATTILHFVIHYASFRYLPGAISATESVIGGFLVGAPETLYLEQIKLFFVGPAWYILSLFWGWCLLNLILDKTSGNVTHIVVAVVTVIGWAWGDRNIVPMRMPYCLPIGLVATGFLYIGYLAKKNKWLSKDFPKAAYWLAGIICLLINSYGWRTIGGDAMVFGAWLFGPLSIVTDGILGFMLVKWFMRWNRYSGIVVDAFSYIGRKALLFFCVHTVEYTAVPWYMFVEMFGKGSRKGLLILFVCRLLLDTVIVNIIDRIPKRSKGSRRVRKVNE